MRTHRPLLTLATLLAVAAALPGQARRPLTHDDCDQWKSLRGNAYSQDGSWVAFQVEPQWGDGVLEVREVTGSRVYRHDFGSGARFSADGRFVVFSVGKSKVEERNKKIEELRRRPRKATRPAEERSEGEGGEARRGGGAGGGAVPVGRRRAWRPVGSAGAAAVAVVDPAVSAVDWRWRWRRSAARSRGADAAGAGHRDRHQARQGSRARWSATTCRS